VPPRRTPNNPGFLALLRSNPDNRLPATFKDDPPTLAQIAPSHTAATA
jgi:hypothetical protein